MYCVNPNRTIDATSKFCPGFDGFGEKKMADSAGDMTSKDYYFDSYSHFGNLNISCLSFLITLNRNS